MKKFLITFIILFFTFSIAYGLDDIIKYKNCKYCGMDREKFSHSRMLITYENDEVVATCSLHCTAIELAVNIDKTIKKIEVADYYIKKLIDAEKAFWVIGGKITGVMTKNAKWAFEKKDDAERFIKENEGKIANFEESMREAYSDMYNDTKMIREKRKKMKKTEEQKHGGHSH